MLMLCCVGNRRYNTGFRLSELGRYVMTTVPTILDAFSKVNLQSNLNILRQLIPAIPAASAAVSGLLASYDELANDGEITLTVNAN